MTESLDASALTAKFDGIKSDFPDDLHLRIRRALSWIERAEMEASRNDYDAQFIFLWTAFNAAYAKQTEFKLTKPEDARDAFQQYFEKLVELDSENRIYNALWEKFSGPVQTLMKNEFVYQPFWNFHNGIKKFKDWEVHFTASIKRFKRVFQGGDCVRVLNDVFARLYVLRNQLIHGGATWNSNVNRQQVRDGAAILEFLMPIFVDIMMDNPSELELGKPFYPRVAVPLS